MKTVSILLTALAAALLATAAEAAPNDLQHRGSSVRKVIEDSHRAPIPAQTSAPRDSSNDGLGNRDLVSQTVGRGSIPQGSVEPCRHGVLVPAYPPKPYPKICIPKPVPKE